jgi:putative oxidoreductase
MQDGTANNPESVRVRNAADTVISPLDVSERHSSWPASFDWGLLCLRVWFGLSLFVPKARMGEPTNFARMAAHFPNPLHLGSLPSLIIALISDAICSILVLLGLGTSWAALYIICNTFVALGFVHHFQFFGRGAPGEVIGLYIAGFLAIAIMGPGHFSLDRKLGIGSFARTRRS